MPKNSDNETKASLPQRKRFDEAARALGCDESEERFDEALKKVARHKPAAKPGDKKRKIGMNETELKIKAVEIASAMKLDASELIKVDEAIFHFISRSSGSP